MVDYTIERREDSMFQRYIMDSLRSHYKAFFCLKFAKPENWQLWQYDSDSEMALHPRSENVKCLVRRIEFAIYIFIFICVRRANETGPKRLSLFGMYEARLT